jgi:transcriptional regulator with XRE-family HTH domain
MISADRLKRLMTANGMSQAELARRVGVRQPTIYKLLTGENYGSTHLHKIARELGTTPAYLTGETDDPFADAPELELSFEQRHLIESFNMLDRAERVALIRIVDSMARRSPPPETVHDARNAYAAEQAAGR